MKKAMIDVSRRSAFLGLFALDFVLRSTTVRANPQGLTVISGAATTTQQGTTTQITTSQNAFLQWNSFNIAAGETTIFQQPSASSIVFNIINNPNPSSIFGSLHANGIVVLENQNGFYFGPHAFVSANGLVLTTAAINPFSPGGGIGWSFDGPPTSVPIVNYGQLQTAQGGSLFVIAKQINNYGTISAPGGTAALVAGQEVLLSDSPTGLSLSAPVKLPAGSVNNAGQIIADAGQVLLQAQNVNNSGLLQANSVREQNGVIELYASQDLQLGSTSSIQANGDGSASGPGGKIVVKSDGSFSDTSGSQISAQGGANGGNGGSVEISAPDVQSLNSSVNTSAQNGGSDGSFALDPENITLSTTGTTSGGTTGTVNGTGSTGTLTLNVNTAFQNIASGNILLEASGTITLAASSPWNVTSSADGRTSGQLTLEAGGNITLNSSITDANQWSISLYSGYNFTTHSVTSGTGAITLAGSSSIKTAEGSINVVAGQSVTVNTGGIVSGIANTALSSSPGGNVSVQAMSGNVSCGTGTVGYSFSTSGYTVSPTLTGISSANGGNVTIQAGGNISAALPTPGAAATDFGSGAFGPNPGNVVVMAGGNVTGHYVLADGTGLITGANVGTSASQLALSLIKGGWTVGAVNNIVLQEVRNPNGSFNNAGSAGKGGSTGTLFPYQFLYDYDPLASVFLDAGNAVDITGTSLPRASGESTTRVVFPPILTIDAGAGGLTLGTATTSLALNLFPSPDGTLDINITDGGSLIGNVKSGSINISDSASTQGQNPNTFTTLDPNLDEALHLNDPNPVSINVSGSVSDFTLTSPKSVQMTVGGNMIDSGASIQNLHSTDISSISVGGEILDHSDYVIYTLPSGEKPNFTALDQVGNFQIFGPDDILIPNPNLNPILENQQLQFTYNAALGVIKYEGKMSSDVEQALLAMKTPFLDPATIEAIYAQSQIESPAPDPGYTIAGPGALKITAGSMDLGNGGGIVSQGVENHMGLLPYTARGADLDISVAGNLSMLSSTIESEFGGDINVDCGGTLNVGSAIVPSTSKQYPLGIVSLWQGNISVIANGDINVDGSRIAAYDGGNVFVESLTGDVNAGAGGAGEVQVVKPNPYGHGDLIEQIPGSGILATSFPQLVPGEPSGHIGNITVETPEGNIEASKGGIVQIALGPVASDQATINLVAGSHNPDGSVAYVGNVDASGSGVVGGQVNINATGNINGLVVASLGANITALQNVSATVLSSGNATVSAGGTVSGTVVGVGSVSVSGTSDAAAAFAGGGVTTSGSVSGAAVTAAPTGSSSAAAAATTQQVAQTAQAGTGVADAGSDDNDPLKRKRRAQLMEYVGRVTVLLPH